MRWIVVCTAIRNVMKIICNNLPVQRSLPYGMVATNFAWLFRIKSEISEVRGTIINSQLDIPAKGENSTPFQPFGLSHVSQSHNPAHTYIFLSNSSSDIWQRNSHFGSQILQAMSIRTVVLSYTCQTQSYSICARASTSPLPPLHRLTLCPNPLFQSRFIPHSPGIAQIPYAPAYSTAMRLNENCVFA